MEAAGKIKNGCAGEGADIREAAEVLEAKQKKMSRQEPMPMSAEPSADTKLMLQPRKDFKSAMHYVRQQNRYVSPFPGGLEMCVFAAGCFWGTEKGFWRLPGVYATAVGYIDGNVQKPSYQQVCSGRTGHTEATLVVWDPALLSFSDLLHRFFDCHDPTQGDGQGHDRGTQYRSGIYCSSEEQATVARACLVAYESALTKAGFSRITSHVKVGGDFWYAEEYHQQYLAKPNARQYCSAEPTGVAVPPASSWALDASIAAKHAPKLPVDFWASYDGSIRAPNAPVEMSASALAMAAAARAEAEAARDVAEARARTLHTALIRFCGGCGFRPKAEELAARIKSAAGIEVGLVQDVGSTGNFEIEVKIATGVWEVVHSKKGGDGFVDTDAKMTALLAALTPAKATEAHITPADAKEMERAQEQFPGCVIGLESIMSEKAHGTSDVSPMRELRFGADRATADRISNFNRHYAEHAGYFLETTFVADAKAKVKAGEQLDLYDVNTGAPLFRVGGPDRRSWEAFYKESKAHGWPSFRTDEVNWDHVRVLPSGEVVSKTGTHLGHNLPDKSGNRFCINLVSIAGSKQ